MPIICPAILASTEESYREQITNIAHVASRIQIDLTDGEFASNLTIKPTDAWWPVGFLADFHLMFKDPSSAIKIILKHRPNMIIVHAESEGDFAQVVTQCKQLNIKVGVALLPQTSPQTIVPALGSIDHILIFSGSLGTFGGHADLSLLSKVAYLKKLKPEIEIGWDGGVNVQNTSALVTGGVDVLTVGGYIQKSDDPVKAFNTLDRIADETGTT